MSVESVGMIVRASEALKRKQDAEFKLFGWEANGWNVYYGK